MKILLEAFVCNDRKASEARTGYRWIELLVQGGHEVTVVTRSKSVVPEGTSGRINVDPRLFRIRAVTRKWIPLRVLLEPLYYQIWLWSSYLCASAELRSGRKFDLLFHCTYGSLLQGTFLTRLSLPLVFCGGGIEDIPKALRKYRGSADRIRDILLTLYRPPLQRALLFVPNTPCARWLKSRGYPHVTTLPDAIPMVRSFPGHGEPRPPKIRIAFVNTYTKPKRGAHILQRALRLYSPKNIELHVFGRPFSQDSPFVINHGLLTPEAFQRSISGMQYYLLPSYREAVSTSLVEALQLGLNIICFDGVGIGDLIPESACVLVESASGDGAENLALTLRSIDLGELRPSPNTTEIHSKLDQYYGQKRKEFVESVLNEYARLSGVSPPGP